MARFLIVAASLSALLFSFAQAQDKKDAAEKKAPIAPAEKLAEGWEEIDERLIFLMVRLANTESSLEAVEKVIGAGSRKASARISESKRAIGENEKMDRKGGGPMKWSQFYGTTAEKFFYHPTDRNSSYHTATVLSPQPPQSDNQTGAAKAETEAAGLRGKVEALTARRRNLELEQVALWVEIAFRAAAHFELNRKPVFRFEPVLPADDPDAKLHADIMKTSAEFMRVALAIVDEAPKDQDGTLTRIKPAIVQAREKLDDSWLRLAIDTSDRNTVEGRFFALSKRLNDVSRNLTESYEISIDGDINADEVRKDTFRGQLQDSLISYAQIVLALDEMATQMKDQWNVKPDLDKPYTTVSLSSITPVRMSRAANQIGVNEPKKDATANAMQMIQGEWKCVAMEEIGTTFDKKTVKEQDRRVIIDGNSYTMKRTQNGKRGEHVGRFEIDASVGVSCRFAKILTRQHSPPPAKFLNRPSQIFLQPTHTKRQSVIAGGAEVESQECQKFFLGIVSSSTLQQSSGNSQHYAGTTSESIWVECGSLFDLNYAKVVSSIAHFHSSKCRANKKVLLCRIEHDFAYLSEAANSQPRTC